MKSIHKSIIKKINIVSKTIEQKKNSSQIKYVQSKYQK